MSAALKLAALIRDMSDDRYWYTGDSDTPGLTYRESALVVVWSGKPHFVVAPRDGPVLTFDMPLRDGVALDGFVEDMCTDPRAIIEMLILGYKIKVAPSFS